MRRDLSVLAMLIATFTVAAGLTAFERWLGIREPAVVGYGSVIITLLIIELAS